MACSSWPPRTTSNAHGSSITTKSDVLPCNASGVGGNGRTSPVEEVQRMLSDPFALRNR